MSSAAFTVPLWLSVLGILVNALVGSLAAFRDDENEWDVIGLLTFALLMGLAGGFMRDLLLGQVPPLSLREIWPIGTVVAGAVLGRLLPMSFHTSRVIGSLEALALGLFAAAGTAAADGQGLPATSSVLIGAITAVGGGVLVSMLRGEIPAVLQPSRPHALLATVVGIVYLGVATWDVTLAYVISICASVVLYLIGELLHLRTWSVTSRTQD